MRTIATLNIATLLFCIGTVAQIPNKTDRYLDHAEVQHAANFATVTANYPRPLEQAIEGISEEYGWTVDFEDPPYSQHDLVDDTDPTWRAEHPAAKGVTALRGGTFQSQYPEGRNTGGSVAEEKNVLDKVVSDYNQSGNSGKFSVRDEGGDRFSVIGITVSDATGADEQVPSVLDIPVSVPSQSRDGLSSIQAVLAALSTKSGKTVHSGTTPMNLFLRTTLVVGGDNVPARTLLKQIIAATHRKLYWGLLYDSDGKAYYFNLAPVMQAAYDANGNRTTDFAK